MKVLESRRGSTSVEANPWFALDRLATAIASMVRCGLARWDGAVAANQRGATAQQQVSVTGI